jgi:hypothetical protein
VFHFFITISLIKVIRRDDRPRRLAKCHKNRRLTDSYHVCRIMPIDGIAHFYGDILLMHRFV